MGACSQAPHAAPRQRQMGTFYTWSYFSYWEVMQPNFLLGWWIVHIDFTANFFFFFFYTYDSVYLLQMTMLAWGTLVLLPAWCFIPSHTFFFFIYIAKVIHWSWSKSCTLHPHPISFIVTHSYSLSSRWWCRKFIFFVLCTIVCMCHLISLIQM